MYMSMGCDIMHQTR